MLLIIDHKIKMGTIKNLIRVNKIDSLKLKKNLNSELSLRVRCFRAFKFSIPVFLYLMLSPQNSLAQQSSPLSQ